MGFPLEARSNSKITLIKIKCYVFYHGNNSGNHGYCGQRLVQRTYNGRKMLKTIIAEATFLFYLGFLSQTFTIYKTTGEGGGYLCNFSLPLPPAS